jgi:hypothetical protein
MDEVTPITRAEYAKLYGGQEEPTPISRAEYSKMYGGGSPGEKAQGVLTSATQGLTFGLGDEIVAGLDAGTNYVGDMLRGRNKDISIGQQYDAALEARRGPQKQFEEQNPIASTAAEIAGNIPTAFIGGAPSSIAGAMKLGAGLGGLYGFGKAEGGAAERAKGAAMGGAVGGLASGAIAGAGKFLKGAGTVADDAGQRLKAGALGATKTDFKMSAKYKGLIDTAEGGKSTKLMQSIQNVIDDGTFTKSGASSAEDMLLANTSRIDSYDDALAKVLADADSVATQSGVRIEPTFSKAKQFLARANPLEKKALEKEFAEAQLAIGDALDGSLSKMQEVKRSLYRSVYSENGKAKQELARALAEDLKDGIERGAAFATKSPEMAAKVKALNAKMGEHLEVQTLLTRRLGQEQGSDAVKGIVGALRTSGGMLTTPTVIGGLVGGSGGGALGLATGAAINLAGRPGSRMALGKGLQSVAPKIGQAGRGLMAASPLGGFLGGIGGASSPKGKKEGVQMEDIKAPKVEQQDISAIIEKTAGSPEMAKLTKAVIRAESNGDPRAQSGAGAQGLMQIMPAMQKSLGVKDPFDPADNIRGGVALLKEEIKRFGGNLELALAAYNAGSPKVKAAIAKAGSMDWEEVAKYLPEETRNYVPKVKKYIEV